MVARVESLEPGHGRGLTSACSLVILACQLALVACDSNPTSVPADETEPFRLLANGDVESGAGAPDAWTTGATDDDEFVFEWSTLTAVDGARSLSIESLTSASGSFAFWRQSLSVGDPSGVMYQLTAWVKVDQMSGRGAAIAVRADDPSLSNGFAEAFASTQELQVIGGTGDWRLFSVGLTGIPAGASQITVFLIHLGGGGGTVFFDNVQLTVVEGTDGLAGGYMFTALNIMEFNSIKRHLIDWPSFRAQANADAAGAQIPAHTYRPIRLALERLGDNHSFFRPPPPTPSPSPRQPFPTPPPLRSPPAPADPAASLLDGDIGYVEVPAFSGGGQEANELATHYHRLVESVDAPGTCGWVVDLRGNTGGNMWPMVAGVGPILGEGIVGYFVDPDGVSQSWFYEAGQSGIETSPIVTAADPYELLSSDPPVAVLTDSLTASSGEATAIAFRGRPDARSFGEPTWGVSTANQGFGLSDGATIVLTVSTMADRTRQLYGLQVFPDEIVEGAKTGDPATDAPLQRAITWLRDRPACQSP